MPFIVVVLFCLGIYGAASVMTEYKSIKARLATTQNKVDALADETNATVEILGAAITDLRELFSKLSSEAKPSLPSYKTTQEVTQEVTPEVKVKPTVIMHSGEGCAPCKKWKSESKQVWEDAGWDVVVIDEKPEQATRRWPWFEVQDSDGTRFEVDGALTSDTFKNAKQRLTR